MVKKRRWRYRPKTIPMRVDEMLYGLLERMGGSQPRSRLASLWVNWSKVLGEELAMLAMPIGNKGHTLLLQCEDAIQMQELHFLAEDIRERANHYLQADYFKNVHLTLEESGKNCRGAKIAAQYRQAEVKLVKKCQKVSGKYLENMTKDSPVARCYAAFAGKSL